MPDSHGIWNAGLQSLDARFLIKGFWPSSLVANTMIPSLPQLIYSILYFTLNPIFTIMTLSAEWSQYALHGKGLRVSSSPQFSQRSSYFLSLPYHYIIPLLTESVLILNYCLLKIIEYALCPILFIHY